MLRRILRTVRGINHPAASLLLGLVLAADLAFIALHTVRRWTPLIDSTLYSIAADRGYAEVFQYIKFFWIVLLLALAARSTRIPEFASWIAVFAYLLLDDAGRIHEDVGRLVAQRFRFSLPFGLRLQEFGEVIVWTLAGVMLVAGLAWAYARGAPGFRKVFLDLSMLTLILVFFGGFFDLLHIIAVFNTPLVVGFIFQTLEDGGEMVTVSVILWYTFALALRGGRLDISLHEALLRDARARGVSVQAPTGP